LLPLKALADAEHHARVISPLKTKPIRTVLLWQLVATAGVAAIAAVWVGERGAISALLGGVVNFFAGVVYALLLGVGIGSKGNADAGTALVAMLRAEAAKIVVIVGGLWITLSTYADMVPAAFFTAFVITVVVFSMAFFVRD
jgi:F0F1-type ATP synthase assembly protein I